MLNFTDIFVLLYFIDILIASSTFFFRDINDVAMMLACLFTLQSPSETNLGLLFFSRLKI